MDNAAFASGTAKSHAFGGAVQGAITSSGSVSASQASSTRNVASAENSVGAESLAVGGAIASGGGSDTSWIYGQPAYLENSRFVSNKASAFGTQHVAAFGGAFMAEPRRMYTLSVLQNTASATTHYSGSQASRYALAIGGGASTGKINFADSTYNAQASQPGGDAPWDEESHHGIISRLLADSGDSDSGQRGNQYKFDSVTFSENKAEARLLTGSNYVGFVEQSDYAAALGGGWALVFEWSGDVAMSAITLSRNTASALSDGFATPEVNAAAGGGVFRFGESGNKAISGLEVSANLAEATLKASSATSNFRLEANAKAGGLGISGGELKASDTVVFSANKAAARSASFGAMEEVCCDAIEMPMQEEPLRILSKISAAAASCSEVIDLGAKLEASLEAEELKQLWSILGEFPALDAEEKRLACLILLIPAVELHNDKLRARAQKALCAINSLAVRDIIAALAGRIV